MHFCGKLKRKDFMTVCEAVTARIKELLAAKNITLYRFAENSGVRYDTLKKIVSNDNKSVNFSSVIEIAGGFGMTIAEFVDCPLFSEENLNI